ncbi:hypothetical protein R3P38DRAFT_2807751 [Favolaschia claudopus]|uniref:Transposase zinc-ribbon domain-containing protein n=1 Tax=Favolaschia claudopus TaxID=2862362 RepID=A0AAV9ZJ69_9AGAR
MVASTSTSTAAGQPVQSTSNASNAGIRSGRPAARNNAAPAGNAAPQTVPMTIEEHFARFGALTHEARIAGAEDFIVGRRPAKCRITLDDADEAFRCPICHCLQTYPVRIWLKRNFSCPMCTRVMLTAPFPVPAVNGMIEARFPEAQHPVKYTVNWGKLWAGITFPTITVYA